jgi:hypothetical protein
MFLENLNKLERSLWNSYVEFVGRDDDMAEMYAADRNDVLDVKAFYFAGLLNELKVKIDRMDTHPREGVVCAFAEDLGEDWVFENLGYEVL